MLAKRCPTCNAVWYTALPKCAFCGIEGVEVPTSTHTGRLPEKPAPAVQLEVAKESASTAVAEATPLPPTHSDPEPTPIPETKIEAPPPPPPPIVERAAVPAAPSLVPLSAAEKRPDPSTLPSVPLVPSAKVPLAFALHGVAAIALIAVAAFVPLSRIGGILVYLASAVLIPFAPLAWLAGLRYESRCIDLGFRPDPLGRTGRILGTVLTIVLALEGSALAVLTAVARMNAGK